MYMKKLTRASCFLQNICKIIYVHKRKQKLRKKEKILFKFWLKFDK